MQLVFKMVSQPRQNFHSESEAGINKQINMELYASYVYQAMVSGYVISIYGSHGYI